MHRTTLSPIARDRWRLCLSLLALLTSSAQVARADITYNLNTTIGGFGLLTGQITTDGTLGPLNPQNIVSWNLAVHDTIYGYDFTLIGVPDPGCWSTVPAPPNCPFTFINGADPLYATPTQLQWRVEMPAVYDLLEFSGTDPVLGPVSILWENYPALNIYLDGYRIDTQFTSARLTPGSPVDLVPPVCGNSVVEASETCDPPGSTPSTPAGNGNACRADCTYCGDGITNGQEQCDDGNSANGDGCSSTCQIEVVCGNSIVQAPETCDPPGPTVIGEEFTVECRQDCTYCGDGIVQAGETCDDGNRNNSDACHNNCTKVIRNDPAIITYRSGNQVNDRLHIHGRFVVDEAIGTSDIANQVIGIQLTNNETQQVVFRAEVPAKSISVRAAKRHTFFNFTDDSAKSRPNGGIKVFNVVKSDNRWYRVTASAYGDLSAAMGNMTVEVFFGDKKVTSSGKWRKTLKGWYLYIK